MSAVQGYLQADVNASGGTVALRQGGAVAEPASGYLWDLAELPLRPGVQISYYVEVTDNDNVLGPNVGRSQTYKLRLFSPRERHEEHDAQDHERQRPESERSERR
mgnify:CR=1 FL=1